MRALSIAFVVAFPIIAFAQDQKPVTSLPLPSRAQVRWHASERIMFVHFSANTWQVHRGLENEWDDHSISLDRIDPKQLNTDQWCEVASSWGAKMIIFVAKHVGGFCFWQTATTDYGIRNTPWKNGKGDVLEDLSRSCMKFGLDLGIYLYPGDPAWGAGPGSGGITSDPAKQEAYTKVFRQQMTEVLSRYGAIREVWFDGSCRIDVADILQQYAPDAVIFQGPQASLRWVGNEDGFAPFSNWYTLSSKDLRTGVATSAQSDPFGDAYAPVEIDVPLLKNKGHKWFWAPNTDHLILTTDQLMDMYYKSVGRGSVLLLNSTPDTTGLIPASHAAAYRAFGDEIRKRFETPLATARGTGRILQISLPSQQGVNHVVLHEDVAQGQRVLEFTVRGLDRRGRWKELYSGTSIGSKRICWFTRTEVKTVQVVFTNVKAEPRIANMALYDIQGTNPTPDVRNDRAKFYDGVASRQAADVPGEPPVPVGEWTVSSEAEWREYSVDLTKEVTRIGQYVITFVPPAGKKNAGLEFKDPVLEMYGGMVKDGVEVLKPGAAFRITRSQQTLDTYPTVFRVKIRGGHSGSSGKVTIRPIVY
jgi:alpha-L-fucosidase